MLELGKRQQVKIIRLADHGAYINDDKEACDDILLPIKQLRQPAAVNDRYDVLVYRDSSDRLIATTHISKLTLNQCGLLKVSQVNRNGAYLDWGLEKDLFLPFALQKKRVREDQWVFVACTIDESQRLCATTLVEPFLEKAMPYQTGDYAEGVCYGFTQDQQAKIAIDQQYYALIPAHECDEYIRVNKPISGIIGAPLPDGTATLNPRKNAHLEMDRDGQTILNVLDNHGGQLPYHDHSDPKDITAVFKMSKGAFKRAIGRLHKQQKIMITDQGINRIEKKESE